MIVHGHGGQPRPETAAWEAAVETGDGSHAGLRQAARESSQIIWTNRHVAVGHDDERMARDPPHIDEVGDLTVRAMRGAVDDKVKIEPRDIAQSTISRPESRCRPGSGRRKRFGPCLNNLDGNRSRYSRTVAPRRRTAASGSRRPATWLGGRTRAVGQTSAPPMLRPRQRLSRKCWRRCKLRRARLRLARQSVRDQNPFPIRLAPRRPA